MTHMAHMQNGILSLVAKQVKRFPPVVTNYPVVRHLFAKQAAGDKLPGHLSPCLKDSIYPSVPTKVTKDRVVCHPVRTLSTMLASAMLDQRRG